MAKGYGHKFFLAPSNCLYGSMICSKCNNPISSHSDDFVVYQKNKKDGDWGYVTFHRTCYHNDSEWQALEKAELASKAIVRGISNYLNQFRDKDGEFMREVCLALDELGLIQD